MYLFLYHLIYVDLVSCYSMVFYLIHLPENCYRAHMAIDLSYCIKCCGCTSCLLGPSTEGNACTFFWDWIDNNLKLLTTWSNYRLWYITWFPVLLNNNKLIFYKITTLTGLAYAPTIIILCSTVIRL